MPEATHPIRREGIDWTSLQRLLAEEQEQADFGAYGRAAFRLLTVAVYALPAVLALVLLGLRLPNGVLEVLPSSAFYALADATVWLERALAVLVILLPLLVALNLPLIRDAYRQWRLSRQLAAFRLLDDTLRSPPASSWKWAALLLLAAPAALLGLFVASLGRSIRRGQPVTPEAWVEAAAVLGVMVLLPAALYFAEWALRRLRSRLDYLREVMALRQAIEGDERHARELPADLICRLADVERARILRQSAAALEAGRSRADRGFALRKSAAAAAVLDRLPAAMRMEIERALEELAARQGGDAPELGRPTIKVLAGPEVWRVEFHVDVDRRTIEVIVIEPDGEPRE